MKKFFLLPFVFIPEMVAAATLYSSCPSGYLTIIEKNAKIYASSYPTSYSFSSSYISSNSCSASTLPAVCYLYAQTSLSFSDSYGTYDFTNICQYEHSTSSSTDGGVVVKCVKNSGSAVCTSATASGRYDWSASCSGVAIKGVAACSSNSGSATNRDTRTSLTISETNNWCWCRVVSPGVTPWILGSEYVSESDCLTNCAGLCSFMAGSTSNSSYTTYRSKIFSNLNP